MIGPVCRGVERSRWVYTSLKLSHSYDCVRTGCYTVSGFQKLLSQFLQLIASRLQRRWETPLLCTPHYYKIIFCDQDKKQNLLALWWLHRPKVKCCSTAKHMARVWVWMCNTVWKHWLLNFNTVFLMQTFFTRWSSTTGVGIICEHHFTSSKFYLPFFKHIDEPIPHRVTPSGKT